MNKLIFSIFLSAALSITSFANTSNDTKNHIQNTLYQAGLQATIQNIRPSGIGDLLLVEIKDGPMPLLITPKGDYLIQGHPENNPSPAVLIQKSLQTKQPAGTPITGEYKNLLLANTKNLKNMTADSMFFYTNIHGILWGVSGQGGTPFLISADGRYFINGDISSIKNGEFSEIDSEFEWSKNNHVLASLDKKSLIAYPADNQKAVVYIATDVHCPYCRLFHKDIKKYNQKGISVFVIGYPVYDESPEIMRQIWCETDNKKRQMLLDSAMKNSNTIKNNHCKTTHNPLAQNQKTAQALAIMATPAIFREDGVLFEGDFRDDEFFKFLGL